MLQVPPMKKILKLLVIMCFSISWSTTHYGQEDEKQEATNQQQDATKQQQDAASTDSTQGQENGQDEPIGSLKDKDKNKKEEEQIFNFAVNYFAEEEHKTWMARALELNTYQDISSYSRLKGVATIKEDLIQCTDLDCRLEVCEQNEIHMYMEGVLTDSDIDYEIYDVEKRLVMSSGSLSVTTDTDLNMLRINTYKAIIPFTSSGGILDHIEVKKRRLARVEEDKESFAEFVKLKEEELKAIAEGRDLEAEKEAAKKEKEEKEKAKREALEGSTPKEKGGPGADQSVKEGDETGKTEGEKEEGSEDQEQEDAEESLEQEDTWTDHLFAWFTRMRHEVHYFAQQYQETLVLIVSLSLIIFSLLPSFIHLLLVQRKSRDFRQKLSMPTFTPFFGVLFLILLMNVFGGDPEAIDLIKGGGFFASFGNLFLWFIPVLGGVLWGIFLLFMGRSIFPRIQGFENIEHQHITPLVKSWISIFATRVFFLGILYVPAIFLFRFITIVYEIPFSYYLTIVLPISLFYIWFWFKFVFEIFALYLDQKIVLGPALDTNPWHESVMKYLEQYQKRMNFSIDSKLLKRILFLPHRGAGVYSYGGGFSKARIAIDRKLLALALGLPDEEPDEIEGTEKIPVDFTEVAVKREVSREYEIDDSDQPANTGEFYEIDEIIEVEGVQDEDNESLRNKFVTDYMKLDEFQKISNFRQFEVDLDKEAKDPSNDNPRGETDFPDQFEDAGREGVSETVDIDDVGFDKSEHDSDLPGVSKSEENIASGQTPITKEVAEFKDDHQFVTKEVVDLNEDQSKEEETEPQRLPGEELPEPMDPVELNQQNEASEIEGEAPGQVSEEGQETEPVQESEMVMMNDWPEANFVLEVKSVIHNYKDFLFGLLLSEMGHIKKQSEFSSTFTGVLDLFANKLPERYQDNRSRFQTYCRNHFSRYSYQIADSMAHTYYGIPHLAQYLYYKWSRKKDLLTSNADSKQLLDNHLKILTNMEYGPRSKLDTYENNATEVNRVAWLMGYIFPRTVSSKARAKKNKLRKRIAIALVLAFCGYSIVNSILYHRVYAERIAEQQEKIDEKKRQSENDQKEDSLPIKKP